MSNGEESGKSVFEKDAFGDPDGSGQGGGLKDRGARDALR